MANIYTQIRDIWNSSSQAQLMITCLQGRKGNIRDFHRTLGNTGYLSGTEYKEILLSGKPACIDREGTLIFAEPFYKKERVIVYGGGHIALPVVQLAKLVGFYAVVIDDRGQFANRERFPEADEVICDSFEASISRIKPAESDYNVIITRGHKHDILCIRELMQYKEPVYTGLIGSRRRTSAIMEHLTEEGYDRDRLMRIRTPIGLPIGAVTTEEIAVAIIAEIIQRKRLQSAENMAVNRSDGDDRVMELLAGLDRPCCLATIMHSEGSVPRKAGAKMLVFEDTATFGSIGGGCVEAGMIRKAVSMIGSGTYEVIHATLDSEDAMSEGMVCGGSLKLLLEDFTQQL